MKKIKYLRMAIVGGILISFCSMASMNPPVLMSKVDLLVKAAELERQAATKQATDINAAKALREQAKQMRGQADKMKDSDPK